jgi:quinoprotein relay system zinc metallohydrolase 2
MCHLVVTLSCLVQSAIADDLPFHVRKLAQDTYVHHGRQETATAANYGDIVNIGFIIGDRCVAVIDSGGSLRVGEALYHAIRRLTAKPVCYVINTHMHPDHVFGNAAFLPEQPVFVGHIRLAGALAARGQNYTHALQRDLGAAADGSEIIVPTLEVADRLELDLGGRVLELRAWPPAHTDSDLTVFDRKTGTLWLADLLFIDHLPALDGSLIGWLRAIDALAAERPKRIVAGHGESPNWRQALAREQHYLRTLRDETRAALRAGQTLTQAVEHVGVGERDDWLLFDDFHRRNVTAAYAELEWEED